MHDNLRHSVTLLRCYYHNNILVGSLLKQ